MSTSSLYHCHLEPFHCVLLMHEIAARLSTHLITLLIESLVEFHEIMEEFIRSCNSKEFGSCRAEELWDSIDWARTLNQFLFHAN